MRHEHERPRRLARRAFLRTGAVGVGVAAGAVTPLAAAGLAHAASAEDRAAEGAAILTLAGRGELVAATLYERTLAGARFHIEEAARIHLGLLQEAHRQHRQFLRGLGAQIRPSGVSIPRAALGDAGAFVRTGRELEAALAGLYLAAVRELAVLGHPHLAAAAAQVGASAAQHGVVLGHLAGLAPQEVQRPAPPITSVAEAARHLAPYLPHGSDSRGLVSP